MFIPLGNPFTVPAKVYTRWRITTLRYVRHPDTEKWVLNVNLNRCTDDGEVENAKPRNLNIWDMDEAIKVDETVAEFMAQATRVATLLLEIDESHKVNNA